MSEVLKAASIALGDWKHCLASRWVWFGCAAIALLIGFSRNAVPGLPSTVITLFGHGVAFALANLVLANRDRHRVAFSRPFVLNHVLPQQGIVVIAAVAMYLSVLALTLWPDWSWLPLLAIGAPMIFLYIGLGAIPASLLRHHTRLNAMEWSRYSALGALPIIGLNLLERMLQAGLWQVTSLPFAHNLLSIAVAVFYGSIYHSLWSGAER